MAETPQQQIKTTRERMQGAKTLSEMKRIISSVLDIQNKMTSCASADTSPQLNDDYPLGNFARDDEISLKWNFILARTAVDLGGGDASMNFFHENNELANITRGRNGFQNKIIRSQISHSDTRITEESGGGLFAPRRSKDDSQR